MNRRWEIDALRGLMLVLMALTHLPTFVSDPAGQPFGFVSAAEGFVMLSGFMTGWVYSMRAKREGEVEMRSAFMKRSVKIYLCQAALMVFAFTVIAGIAMMADQTAVTNMLDFYIEYPLTAFVAGLLLLYNPPLLDILPMYILFMLLSPVVLLHGLRQGWFAIMASSAILWAAAQFDLGHAFYNIIVKWTHFKVPYNGTGAFEVFAWQFLWVLGMWMGSREVTHPDKKTVFPGWVLNAAIAIGLTCFIWRHVVGQTPFPGDMFPLGNRLFDKWHLAPLRLLDFFALLVLTMHFGPWIVARLPRLPVLETMGSASLPVFCAHLVFVLLALAWFGAPHPDRPPYIDIGILVVTFFGLWVVAWVTQQLDRRTARLRARFNARRALGLGIR